MDTPTLYLDCLILTATAYPSGFSHSLFTLRRGMAGVISTPFLATLAGPYFAVALAVLPARPTLLAFRGTTTPLLAVAVLLAPVALLTEFIIHALVSFHLTGRLPRGISLQRIWTAERSASDHLLLVLIVLGEEIFYRVIWFGILETSFGLAALPAIGISALAYGLNHLAFGVTSVVSKTVTGVLYGLLYWLGSESVWLPMMSHSLQNVLLFRLASPGRGND